MKVVKFQEATILAIYSESDKEVQDKSSGLFTMSDEVDEIILTLVSIVVLQFIAYYIAL